jgi:hypothetical protein
MAENKKNVPAQEAPREPFREARFLKGVDDFMKRAKQIAAERHTELQAGAQVPSQLAELKRQHDAEADHTNRSILDCKMEQVLAEPQASAQELDKK